ncbi:hypothetical protein RUM44_012223 [Polyplax serrata]|uniref:Uncharacterized protein n=1 Tax=Polyplax serrata TaxID=468196 RepID=A0ABR1BAP0_POLSC
MSFILGRFSFSSPSVSLQKIRIQEREAGGRADTSMVGVKPSGAWWEVDEEDEEEGAAAEEREKEAFSSDS